MSTTDLGTYLAQDRRRSLASGGDLPTRTTGAALFADIAGFTILTDALDQELGARAGGEELVQRISDVYDALIAQVDAFGGSVVGFAGDALLCWFDHSDGMPASRAIAAAAALQAAMSGRIPAESLMAPDPSEYPLLIKVGVATGPVRRLAAGDPAIHLFDVLAGITVDRAVAGERLARPGEVLLDSATVRAAEMADIAEWRMSPQLGHQYAVLSVPQAGIIWQPPGPLREGAEGGRAAPPRGRLPLDVIRPWVLPEVVERSGVGPAIMLPTLKPVVVMFAWFGGIDFASDEGAAQLSAMVHRMQGGLARAGGTLLDLIIGDKGSYVFAAFGALTAHEDDTRRAARVGLEWTRNFAELELKVAISSGVLRVGPYGGRTRLTFGALGAEVNLAARLMVTAAAGEVLVTGYVAEALTGYFRMQRRAETVLPAARSVPVWHLQSERLSGLSEPPVTSPLVGRAANLREIERNLDEVRSGSGRIIALTGEAGVGKSRLIAETARIASDGGMVVFAGQCQSSGASTPWLVWRTIWRDFFAVDVEQPAREVSDALGKAVTELAPELTGSSPLLGSVLGVTLADNDFTSALDAGSRSAALQVLVITCIRTRAARAAELGGGLLFLLDDLHWIDAASHDLLRSVTEQIAELPIGVVLGYRPQEHARALGRRVDALDWFIEIPVLPLSAADTALAIRAKVGQLAANDGPAVTAEVVEQIVERADGNPFYAEELLSSITSKANSPAPHGTKLHPGLPASLHSLVLSRIDQLSARQQVVLKVASVFGRQFRLDWLLGTFPELGTSGEVRQELEHLAELELTPVYQRVPALSFVFKHVVTQEAAYASTSSRARATLHGRVAEYFEAAAQPDLDLLAYHYDLGDDIPKKRTYLRRAGESAAARYANETAIQYFGRALDSTVAADRTSRYELLRARERVFERLGNTAAQGADIASMEVIARELGDAQRRAAVALRRTHHAISVDDYPAARRAAAQALDLAAKMQMTEVAAEAELRYGQIARIESSYTEALGHLNSALRFAEDSRDLLIKGEIFREIGLIEWRTGQLDDARRHLNQALEVYLHSSNLPMVGRVTVYLGNVASRSGDLAAAAELYLRARQIGEQTGDRRLQMQALGNASSVAQQQGDYRQSELWAKEVLRLTQLLNSRYSQTWILRNLGGLAVLQGHFRDADRYLSESLHLARATGDRQHEAEALLNCGFLAQQRGEDIAAETYFQEGLEVLESIQGLTLEAKNYLLYQALQRGDQDRVASLAADVETLLHGSVEEEDRGIAETMLGRAQLAAGHEGSAQAWLRAAVNRFEALGRPDLACEPLALLASSALSREDLGEAAELAERIIAHAGKKPIGDAPDPFEISLICYQVLLAARDDRARALLEVTVHDLHARAGQFPARAEQLAFLQRRDTHRQLLAAWLESR